MEDHFVIEIRGKKYVLVAGLLDAAHKAGLRSIETEILKEFSNPEKEYWVVSAIGRFRTEAGDACWSAIGEACPANSQMRGAYLRHAETRSIARMLRWATNCGLTAAEELGPDAEEVRQRQAPERPQEAAGASAVQRARHDPQDTAERPAAAQVRREEVVRCELPGCGAILTRAQATLSKHKFAALLCPAHAAQRPQREGAAAV